MNKAYLWEKLGPIILKGLSNSQVLEIMLNPNGGLWFVDQNRGAIFTGEMNTAYVNTFVHSLAQFSGQFLDTDQPFLDTKQGCYIIKKN